MVVLPKRRQIHVIADNLSTHNPSSMPAMPDMNPLAANTASIAAEPTRRSTIPPSHNRPATLSVRWSALRWRNENVTIRQASAADVGMSLRLLKFSGGSVDDYAICRSS